MTRFGFDPDAFFCQLQQAISVADVYALLKSIKARIQNTTVVGVIRVVLFLTLILFFNTPVRASTPTPPVPLKKTVLVLFPYQMDLPVSLLATQAIRAEFAAAVDLKLEVYFEYLDLNRFADPDYQQKLFALYAEKYRDRQVDVVILASEVLLNIWLAERDAILPNTPVVFYDINTVRLHGRQLPDDVTGTSANEDHFLSIQWILDARPDIKEIVVVHGVGNADHEYVQPVEMLKTRLTEPVVITDLSLLPLPEIKLRLQSLPSTSVVLYQLMFEDAAGTRYRPIDVLQELISVSPVPVLSGYDQFIGTGTLGGYMYSIDQQARDATQIGLRILRGTDVRDIVAIQDRSNRFIFDHLALQRFGIPLSALPQGSIVKNRQYSVWELYHDQIIVVMALVLVLFVLVVYFIILTRRLQLARNALTHLNTNLENLVLERTVDLERTNQSLALEIADRKQAEDALRESENHLQKLFETMSEGVILITPDGKIVQANLAAEHILGLSRPELKSRHYIASDWEILRPDGTPMPPGEMAGPRAMLDQRPVRDTVMGVRRPDGELAWINVSATPLISNDGKFEGIVGTFADITERKNAEQALKDAHQQLERRVVELSAANLELEKAGHMKDEFLSSMTHELRTPLTGILGLSEAMQIPGGDPLTSRQATYLSHIHANGQRLLELINNILDLSRLDAGKLELVLMSSSLTDICQSCLKAVAAQAQAKNLQVNFTSDPDPIILNTDARRLKQLVSNLVLNAIKFTPQDGRFGVETKANHETNTVTIVVWDEGIGISAEDQERLFQPFVQLDASLARQYSGAGLGLALTQRLVDLFGGSISVQSAPGQGSRFTITIPWLLP